MRKVVWAGLVVLLCAGLVAQPAAADDHDDDDCSDDEDVALPLSIEVEGQQATGHYALPEEDPVGLVLFSHGYGHTSRSWKHHLRNAARDLDVIAVAMDYRNTVFDATQEMPSSRGWRVAEGAADGIAATQLFAQRCPEMDTFVNFGVSMGGNTSGLIAAEGVTHPLTDEALFDWWIDVEGATNVIETYLEATAFAPVSPFAAGAKEDIEQEMGGTLADKPAVYRERAVVTRAEDIKASGVKGVVLVHGLDDGVVPYNQSREMAEALAREGVAYDFYTIARRDPAQKDTTATGTVIGPVKPDYRSPLAGHASETSTTHVVMATALARLRALYEAEDGPVAGCRREALYDDGNWSERVWCD